MRDVLFRKKAIIKITPNKAHPMDCQLTSKTYLKNFFIWFPFAINIRFHYTINTELNNSTRSTPENYNSCISFNEEDWFYFA